MRNKVGTWMIFTGKRNRPFPALYREKRWREKKKKNRENH